MSSRVRWRRDGVLIITRRPSRNLLYGNCSSIKMSGSPPWIIWYWRISSGSFLQTEKIPLTSSFAGSYPGGEDLPPGLDMVALDDPANGNIGLHEVVPKLRCKPGHRRLRFRVDQHFPGRGVTKFHDPVVHRIAGRDVEAFCGTEVGFS